MVDEYQVPEGQVRCFECAGGAGFKTEGMGYCPAAERRTG